jgi:ribonuclease Z
LLVELSIPPYTLRGVSVGGVYTSILVPELDAIFDVGLAPRSFVGASRLFLSHSHADHAGALPALLGQRGLSHAPPPTIFLPREMEEDTRIGVAAFNRGQRHPLEITYVPVDPGDEIQLERELWVRVFRTRHTIPSVGYFLFRRVNKLKDEFLGLPSEELSSLRKSGAHLFRVEERGELAYATDTLIDVLDEHPELYTAKVLILECTFVDEKKSTEATRQKYHIHLDEIVERASRFECEHLVLMHFSQSYSPKMLRGVLKERLPPELFARVQALAPRGGPWPG